MPLWYYEKKELRNTPSCRDGIDLDLESRYRREGARFIVDCGTKLGLRYDSCATGVVFFHRFYMFHSFREFHRYVTAACCLFLAGKTEETPKKCKDIIKTTKTMLTDAQFLVFGDDPKEEVMTMERVLLQTIKFDLMVEHPYACLLKFAKLIKSKSDANDKGKVQKLVQMAWTFINDSLCTMLCLQWEPEVIAVSLMYLASRLTKTEVTDWQGKPLTFKGKWWEYLVEDITQELLEDVCHQVLDLYSQAPKKGTREDSPPPPPPPPPPKPSHGSTPLSATKRPRSPIDAHRSHGHGSSGPSQSKMPRTEKRPHSPTRERYQGKAASRSSTTTKPAPSAAQQVAHAPSAPPQTQLPPKQASATTSAQNNPYMTPGMYSSSFLTQEGSQSIQSLVGGRLTTPAAAAAAAAASTYPSSQYPPGPAAAPTSTQVAPASSATYTSQPPPGYQQSYQQPYQPPAYPPPSQASYSQQSGSYSQPYNYPPSTQYQQTSSTYQAPATQQAPPQQPQPSQQHGQHSSTGYSQNYTAQQYAASQQYASQYPGYNSQNYQQNFAPTPTYPAPQGHQTATQGSAQTHSSQSSNSGGLGIRMTTRP